MKHPLSSLGYYSGSADFNRSGIDNVSADFSTGNIVNASEDFGKTCMSGDFGVDYGEDHYQGGFEGYGHMDHFLGDYDEGMGRRFKKPKIKVKVKSPVKAVAKIASAPIKAAASVAAPVIKPVASVAAPILKPLAVATAVAAPIVIPFAPGLAPDKKPLAAVTPKVVKDVKKIKKVAKKMPYSKKIQALTKKAVDTVSGKGLSLQAIAPAAAALLPKGLSVKPKFQNSEVRSEVNQVVTPAANISDVVSPTEARTPTPQVKVSGQNAHPLLFVGRRLKGELMSGFFDDLKAKIKREGQKVIDQNKAKAVAALQTQATNVVGRQLDRLTRTDPKATAAIQSVVATATETATAKAKQGLADTLKASFDQNKKYIFAVGGGLLALVALKMFMKRKA